LSAQFVVGVDAEQIVPALRRYLDRHDAGNGHGLRLAGISPPDQADRLLPMRALA